MSDIGTARARPLNRLEQMTYPQLELLLPPNWATRDISERRAAGARTFPELGGAGSLLRRPRRATPETGERLYAALGGFVAEEAASLLRPGRLHLLTGGRSAMPNQTLPSGSITDPQDTPGVVPTGARVCVLCRKLAARVRLMLRITEPGQ